VAEDTPGSIMAEAAELEGVARRRGMARSRPGWGVLPTKPKRGWYPRAVDVTSAGRPQAARRW